MTEENILFDGIYLQKPDKASLAAALEQNLQPTDYNFEQNDALATATIVDFMSTIKKIFLANLSNIGSIFDSLWTLIQYSAVGSKSLHIVYDSYLEDSIKECERMRRNAEIEPLEYVELSLSSPIPVQIKRFWACSKNKENLQLLSRQFFIQKALNLQDIVLSGYVTDADGPQGCIKVHREQVTTQDSLMSVIEEADARIIPHIAASISDGSKRIVVLSNDTDVLVLLINYFTDFLAKGVVQLWIKYGLGDKTRYIPVHTLARRLGRDTCAALLKCHAITGCDVTSKLGTKANALKANLQLLLDFGKSVHPDSSSFLQAERYLCYVLYPNAHCNNFDDLR